MNPNAIGITRRTLIPYPRCTGSPSISLTPGENFIGTVNFSWETVGGEEEAKIRVEEKKKRKTDLILRNYVRKREEDR